MWVLRMRSPAIPQYLPSLSLFTSCLLSLSLFTSCLPSLRLLTSCLPSQRLFTPCQPRMCLRTRWPAVPESAPEDTALIIVDTAILSVWAAHTSAPAREPFQSLVPESHPKMAAAVPESRPKMDAAVPESRPKMTAAMPESRPKMK
ncbi:hypothetical protein PO909_012069 [Leuciscus waleckii]